VNGRGGVGTGKKWKSEGGAVRPASNRNF